MTEESDRESLKHPLPFPAYVEYPVRRSVVISEDTVLSLSILFTLFHKTKTFSVSVTHDPLVSQGSWSNPETYLTPAYQARLSYVMNNTLFGLIDEFGGALHVMPGTALIEGDAARLTEVLRAMFAEESTYSAE